MDDRKTCTQCLHYQRGKCMNAKAAQIGVWASIEIARELAEKPQHCPGHVAQPKRKESACAT